MTVQEFDLLNSPLEGTTLIEASAGTGKTYTISGLYLRFILEKELSPEQILVVTFTEAATKELRERVRKRLREAIDAFSIGASEDDLLSGLMAKTENRLFAVRQLTEALRDFDRAAIFTIHGFCQRILHENAFESGSLFDTELVTDQEDLKREIMEDFWRKNFYEASPAIVSYALDQGYTPETFLSVLSRNAMVQGVSILPRLERPDTEAIAESVDQLKEAVETLFTLWAGAREDVIAKLGDPGLHAGSYGNPSKPDPVTGMTPREARIKSLAAGMDEYLSSRRRALPLPSFDGFSLFTASKLAKAAKKNTTPPAHVVFDLCQIVHERAEKVRADLDEYLLFLKIEAFSFLREELPRRKKEQNIQHFDDLLLNLRNGLEQAGGTELASAVRERYAAALIDEFQDTDSIQYAIFHAIFKEAHRPLFLIGDPKQAIYSFRGADIFTYMEAARRADNGFTLTTNWRSEPDLIRAVNTLFSAHPANPFVYEEIAFHNVSASPRKTAQPFTIYGRPDPPLQIWFLGAGRVSESEKVIKKPDAQRLILEALAGEVARLLQAGSQHAALIGDQEVRENDIAVLVRTNDEARSAQEALFALGIPSVLHSTEDLFDSHEAMEMERVLAAVAEPHEEALIRTALGTDMLGMSGEAISRLMTEDTSWEDRVVMFRKYGRLWSDNGFIRMFRHLMLNERIRTRLVSFPDGERRITNLLHLSEVLHHESVERKLGMAELLKWLCEQRDPQFRRNREHQLRLESDENAVKIITIHKSKGLEYPVVFCPFTWGGSRIRNTKAAFAFHDERDGRKPALDLGSPDRDTHRALAEKEALAENMRLLYVALTRAQKRCYLVWGPFNTAETSSLAYLLHHGGEAGSLQDLVSETEAAFKQLDDKKILQRLEEIQARSDGSLRVLPLPHPGGGGTCRPRSRIELPLECRVFTGNIDRSWRISSFSSLVSGKPRRAELPDRDETPVTDSQDVEVRELPASKASVSPVFAFPRGAKSGVLLHDILEHLDFTESDPLVLDQLVASKLKEYGFEPRWQEAVSEMIRNVLALPFFPYRPEPPREDVGGSVETFTLSSISGEERLSELEFYYPLQSLTPEVLRNVFERHGDSHVEDIRHRKKNRAETGLFPDGLSKDWPEDLGRLTFQPVQGFMKGFIDLVFRYKDRFYLLDWKSNYLGNEMRCYTRDALAAVVEKDYYTLQYHLYTVALDLYLSLRVPDYRYEKHFGAVYYVFLRGVDPKTGPDCGVFSARPNEALIRALGAHFQGT